MVDKISGQVGVQAAEGNKMARRGENIHKRKDGQWEGRYIKARTPEGKIQWGYVYGIVYPERRLWSIFRCDLPSTAPWSSAHSKSGRSEPCRRYSPCHGTVLLRCSIVESRTKYPLKRLVCVPQAEARFTRHLRF